MSKDLDRTEQLYRQLEQLERTIIKGQQAYTERNKVIGELLDAGQRKVDIARRLNALRKKCGAAVLTADAIAAVEKRLRGQRH